MVPPYKGHHNRCPARHGLEEQGDARGTGQTIYFYGQRQHLLTSRSSPDLSGWGPFVSWSLHMIYDQLLAKYSDSIIPWGPIGEPVFKRTYSHTKLDGKKETWIETVVRAVRGNVELVHEDFIEANEDERLVELLQKFDALPAGRHLNASGIKCRQFLFNCHASGWDSELPWDHFTFLFDALMQGGGVGANYSNRYLETLPTVERFVHLHVICREDHPDLHEFESLLSKHKGDTKENLFVVPDTREGWVEAVEKILRAAWTKNCLSETELTIDVSQIRERGRPLVTSGGIACGPGPLVSMLVDFVKVVNSCVNRKVGSLDAMMMDHVLASCVVAGGKRRSSRMSVKNWKDHDIFEFINCKREDGSHWSTNISVEVDDGFFAAYHHSSNEFHKQAGAVMRSIILGKRNNGEPGVWNRSLSQKDEREPEEMYCPNPCGEIGLQMWENCNLGHINLQHFANRPLKEMEEAFRLMTRWLIRATFGDITNPRQRAVVNKNRRIGVGFFGFHGFLALRGIKYSDSWQSEEVLTALKRCKDRVVSEAYRYSQQLGIPVPVKNTTLAPTGTIAILPGVSSSAQALFAGWYIRRVRYSDMDPELQVKKSEGYHVYPDPDARNTSIVEYWCEDPLVARVRNNGLDPAELIEAQDDITLDTSLKVQTMLQTHWADNGISFTINMPVDKMPSEEEMEAAFVSAMPFIKGTTFFPDKSRKNAPFERLSKATFDAWTGQKEISSVEDLCKGGCPVK